MKKQMFGLLLTTLVSGVSQRVGAQQVVSAPVRVLEGLKSPDPLSRARAFAQLSEKQRATTQVRGMLLDLLIRENRVMDSLNVIGTGTSLALGEDYTDYLAEVVGECYLHCNRSDPKVIKALVTTMYSYDSELAEMLARDHGLVATSIMLERAENRVPLIRQIALQNLGTFYVKGRGLTADQKTRIHALARKGTGDSSAGMRISAAGVLGRIGSRDDLPLLRRVARSDLVSIVAANGAKFYPVREASDSAIARIERRPPE